MLSRRHVWSCLSLLYLPIGKYSRTRISCVYLVFDLQDSSRSRSLAFPAFFDLNPAANYLAYPLECVCVDLRAFLGKPDQMSHLDGQSLK